MPKRATTYHAYHSGSGMTMDAQGGHSWVWTLMVGSKGIVDHGNGAWGGAQIVVVTENLSMPYTHNEQQGHSKAGDSDGLNVDGRTHGM